MAMKFLKLKINQIKLWVAVITVAGIVGTAAVPATARLDELIVTSKPYIYPPAVPVTETETATEILYLVEPGDTLSGIAREQGLSIETLVAANKLTDQDYIVSGQLLRVPTDSMVHQVQAGETLWDISGRYGVAIDVIAARNGLSNIHKIIEGRQLFIPLTGPSNKPARGLAAWSVPLTWPLVGAITSPFGIRNGRPHEGIDIAAEEGTPIRAAASGRVAFAGPRGTYGLAVIIDHGGGIRTLYAHCSKLLVAEGERVDSNAIIALAGNTGHSQGPHLHLEVLKNGVPLDPLMFLERESYYG